MTVDKAISEIDSLVGEPIALTGRVVVTSDDKAFLSSSLDAFKHQQRLLIRDDARIARHPLLSLPPSVGGPCLYYELCTIAGIIRRTAGSFELCELTSCRVRHDDIELEIPLD
jgi:hypothetical protein